MINSNKNSALVHRSDISDGIRALYISQSKMDHLLKEDSYSWGYKEGFETALLSLSQLLGVVDDFQRTQQMLSRLESKRMPLIQGQSS
jgi:hypothetical protein